jgi:hypothetical protein
MPRKRKNIMCVLSKTHRELNNLPSFMPNHVHTEDLENTELGENFLVHTSTCISKKTRDDVRWLGLQWPRSSLQHDNLHATLAKPHITLEINNRPCQSWRPLQVSWGSFLDDRSGCASWHGNLYGKCVLRHIACEQPLLRVLRCQLVDYCENVVVCAQKCQNVCSALTNHSVNMLKLCFLRIKVFRHRLVGRTKVI